MLLIHQELKVTTRSQKYVHVCDVKQYSQMAKIHMITQNYSIYAKPTILTVSIIRSTKKSVWYTYATISVQLSTLFAMVTIGVNNHYIRLFNYDVDTACFKLLSQLRFACKMACHTASMLPT